MKKFSLFFALLLSLVLVLAACGTNDNAKNGGNNDTNNKKEETANKDDLLAKVKDEGKLVVGTEGTYAPFSFHNDKGELTGFDVEIAREVGKRLGVDVEFQETQWDAIFAGLDAKRFDMIANQVGIRPDRQEKYLFSDPYITSAAVLITRTDNKDIQTFEDIKGKKSAQTLTSNYGQMAKDLGAEVVGIDSFNQAVELLNSKRVDATINDKIAFLDFKKNRPDAQVEVKDESEDASQSGLMFRKGSETLVEEVNKALKEMIDDGTYDKISKEWFGENVLK
ncbi:amino acid ABC transporter substrate-binding protein [Bacillus sp. FJAT-18017]|uniref:amino acid ABC transporter substrate-binding protein n=1 Tax=Bacillus sp. FJAT-18017 TaxID=1705566 RepID=UPI0006AEA24B|nr:amino acid ABC transporter substrate-binding protein [Bacillus sp. FJAT-18017]ALC89005.1 amino acid ABC transporter substrate-binding protein [Bacillus sp. FJAT-18017]